MVGRTGSEPTMGRLYSLGPRCPGPEVHQPFPQRRGARTFRLQLQVSAQVPSRAAAIAELAMPPAAHRKRIGRGGGDDEAPVGAAHQNGRTVGWERLCQYWMNTGSTEPLQ